MRHEPFHPPVPDDARSLTDPNSPGPSLVNAITDGSLREVLRGGGRLLIVASVNTRSVLGRPQVARAAHDTAAVAHQHLGVRLDRFLPSREALSAEMFARARRSGRGDTLPICEHVAVDVAAQPLRVSLFRGPRSMHVQALTDYLDTHSAEVGAVLFAEPSAITRSMDQFWLFGLFLQHLQQTRGMWAGDVVSGRWDLEGLDRYFG